MHNMALDILRNYFSNATSSLPSVQEHLATLDCTQIYTKWEDLVSEILDSLPKPYVYQKFVDTLTHINPSHLKHHQEPYGWHALCCGLLCSHHAHQYNISPRIAFQLGFLHDIGKPFTETPSGKTFMHGQIGVHIAQQCFHTLDAELQQVLLFLIDQHMCVCTHTPQERHHICYATLQHMISSYSETQKKQYAAYYKCLVYGDRLGAYRPDIYDDVQKVLDIQTSTVQHLFQAKPMTPPVQPGNFVLVMHGAPGCGKSTMAKRFATAFQQQHMTVGIAERDQAHWILARKMKMVPHDVSFEAFVEDPLILDPNTQQLTTYYKYCYPTLKHQIANHYKEIVLDACEKYDIVILDSCISLNPNVLGEFLTPHDNMFVYTGFPQHLLGRKGSLKVDEQTYYPLAQETAYYRSAIELYKESETPPTPLVSSSCFDELYNLITACWRTKLQHAPTFAEASTHAYPATTINNTSLAAFQAQNPSIVLDQNLKYYKHPQYQVLRLSYYDGKQSGNGTTLHYRGEHLIREASPSSSPWVPLRLSLPVSPETSQLRKFQSHAPLYHYIQPLQQYLQSEFTEPLQKVDPDSVSYNRCFLLPKVDGSLMNVTVVKKHSIQGRYILDLQDTHQIKDFCCTIDHHVYFIGSKSCLFATQASSVVQPFKDSILKSYGSFDAFYQRIHAYLQHIVWDETITLAFESVPEHPYWGLTVDYGRSFVSHLATIYYHNQQAKIQLPDVLSTHYLQAVPVYEVPCSPSGIEEFYCQKMHNALQGKVEDLEGFMLAFTNSDGNLLYMKLKFPWYYAAHKPDIHFREAERLHEDPTYANIKDRLFNLQVAMNMHEIRKNPSLIFEEFSALVIQSFNAMYQPNSSRKDFMVQLFQRSSVPHEDELEDMFKSIVSKFYMKMELKLKNHMASLYDVLVQDDLKTKQDAVTSFYIKFLKL